MHRTLRQVWTLLQRLAGGLVVGPLVVCSHWHWRLASGRRTEGRTSLATPLFTVWVDGGVWWYSPA